MARVSSILFMIAVPIFLITGSISWAFNSPGLYQGGFQRYQVSRVTGISDTALLRIGKELRGYLNSRGKPLAVRARVYGEDREIFNPREVGHMRDVKRLVWVVYVAAAVSAVYLLGFTAGVLTLGRHRFPAQWVRLCLWGGGVTLVVMVVFGLFATLGFDSLFLKFHQLSFANDLWQLDPRHDYLVMLFPQQFWFDASLWFATRTIVGALILMASPAAYLAYRRWAAKRSRNHLLAGSDRGSGAQESE